MLFGLFYFRPFTKRAVVGGVGAPPAKAAYGVVFASVSGIERVRAGLADFVACFDFFYSGGCVGHETPSGLI